MAQANAGLSAYPLKDIPQPHPHDVLCGRGGGTNNHIGNSHWRMLVAANKQLYITLPKRQKMLLSRSIVNAVRSQNPPGRFLQKESKSNFWFDVGDQRAQEKTSQALREGAPDIRSKIAQHQDKDGEAEEDDVEPTESLTESKTDDSKTKPTQALSSTEVKKEQQLQPQQEKAQPTATVTPPKSNGSIPEPRSKGQSSPKQPQQQQAPPAVVPPSMHTGVGSQSPIPGGGAAQASTAPQMMNTGYMAPPGMSGQPQMHAGQNPQFVMNGSNMQQMHPNQLSQNPQGGMLYYAGPNMTPMQVYPTMVLNEQGVLVPAMSVVPTMMPHQPHMMGQHQQHHQNQHQQNQHQHQQHYQQGYPPPTAEQTTPQSSGAGSAVTAPRTNQNEGPSRPGTVGREPSAESYEPLPANSTINFDEYMAMLPPGVLEPAGLSFGSIEMTDGEQRKLESTGTSFGSVMSYNYTGNQRSNPHHHHPGAPPTNDTAAAAAGATSNQHPNQSQGDGDDAAPAALDSLEPTGISFGDVSMMSVGTKGKLENTGTSFGSMMSYSAVEGGLEAIGTSFGSLSLDTTNKDSLFKSLELAAAGPTIPPMFQAQRSTGNLLECSDTESEDSDHNQQLVAQKSQAWENMQATFAAQRQNSQDMSKLPPGKNSGGPPMPGPPGQRQPQQVIANFPGGLIDVPTTNLEPNFSALSAWEHDEDDDDGAAAMPPPPPMEKHDSEGDKLEFFYLQGGGGG